MSDIALSRDYIEHAVQSHYNDLKGQNLRLWGRIQRKLDAAVEGNTAEINFEEAEKDFIVEAFKDAAFPSHLSKYVVVLLDEIEKLRTEAK